MPEPSEMICELVEFLRENRLDEGRIRRGDRYLLVRGDRPVESVEMPLEKARSDVDFNSLRYRTRGGPVERTLALRRLSAGALEMMRGGWGDVPEGQMRQIDLVTNPRELSELPFEAALGDDDRPLFARRDSVLVLTRRVRENFDAAAMRWWVRPRVLYVWAQAEEMGRLPFSKNRGALVTALTRWIDHGKEEDARKGRPVAPDFLVECGNANLNAVAKACAAAADAHRPFTHIHILAHGCRIHAGDGPQFGVMLRRPRDTGTEKVSAERLLDAIEPVLDHVAVVTLAVCDGASNAEGVRGSTLAYLLHRKGIPVVLASQYPLTVDGATRLTSAFYQPLLSGEDVRIAVHETRCKLYDNREDNVDWASMVAYVRLPEDYADRQSKTWFQAQLDSLKKAQRRSDHALIKAEGTPDDGFAPDELAAELKNVEKQLTDGIADLENMPEHDARRSPDARSEHWGLRGSARKRTAEVLYQLARLDNDPTTTERRRKQLKKARDAYREGFLDNLSSHWNGVQYLGLEAVLEGTVDQVGLWYAAREAAGHSVRSYEHALRRARNAAQKAATATVEWLDALRIDAGEVVIRMEEAKHAARAAVKDFDKAATLAGAAGAAATAATAGTGTGTGTGTGPDEKTAAATNAIESVSTVRKAVKKAVNRAERISGVRSPSSGWPSAEDEWEAAQQAAKEVEEARRERIWAHGSLAELYLLARLVRAPSAAVPPPDGCPPYRMPSMIEEAEGELRELVRLCLGSIYGADEFIDSTRRQLARYKNWWTKANGFFTTEGDLSADADQLLAALNKMFPPTDHR